MPTLIQKVARSPRRRKWISNTRSWLHRATISGLEIEENVTIGRGVHFETHRSIPGTARIMIGTSSTLDDSIRLEAWGGSIRIAPRTHIGAFTVVYGHGGVTIGEGTLVSPHCCILSSNHDIPRFDTPIRSQDDILKPTVIGSDVWIGAGSIILGGVSIGNGAVIGAGAVVARNVEAGAVCVGVPARQVSSRNGSPLISS